MFADWPYLYAGSLDYEMRYLASLRDSPGAVVVGAWDGARLVGAATGVPLEDHAPGVAAALDGRGFAPGAIFYCAESVLMPEYRGQGAGHRFFDLRESHACRLGRTHAAFASVIRPAGHPARPPGARSLEPFWRARGYVPVEGAVARLAWREHGAPEETEKPLQVWIRRLDGPAPVEPRRGEREVP